MNNKTKLKTIIRQIVREEVAMAIQEVITELKQPPLSSQQVSQPKSKKKTVKKKQYTKNSILNEVMNETANDDSWKTMGGGTYDSSKMGEVLGNTYGDTKDAVVKSTAAAAGVNPNNLPEHVTDALTKDYRGLMKATDEKTKQKRGS